MRLNRLGLTNFRLHADTRIDFETGLTGIIGPNGSGKTTILEAIAWALYGMSAVRGKRQDIRSLNASGRAGVRVELDFDLAGHRHRVVRTLSTAELYLDGASAPIANSTSGVTDLLRRRLGMSQQEFFNTYFTGQKELGIMAAMGPAERAQFLSRVLGYEKLRGAQTLVRERRSLLRGELAGLQTGMPDGALVARLLADTEARLKHAETRTKAALAKLKKASAAALAIRPRWAEAQRARDAHQQIVAELAVKESEGAALARDLERLEKALAEVVAARAEMERIRGELEVQKDLETQLLQMNRLFEQETKRRLALQNHKALTQEVAGLRERSQALSGAAESRRDAERARDALRLALAAHAEKLEVARTDWVRDQQEALTKLEEYRKQFADVKQQREQLATLGPDSPCPICTRPLRDHFREVLDDLDEKLTAIEVDGKYFRSRVEQLASAPTAVRELEHAQTELEKDIERHDRLVAEAQGRAQEHAQLVRDLAAKETRLATIAAELEAQPVAYHETKHAQMRNQYEQLAPLAKRSAQLSSLIEDEPKLKKEHVRVRKGLATVNERVAELTRLRKESKFTEAGFAELRVAVEAAGEQLREAEMAGLAAEKEQEAARVARTTAEEGRRELERFQERMRVLAGDRRLHDELDQAFTDIRSDLNAHLRPELSELASGFLAELTDGRYTDLELDEDYNIIVKEDDIPKPVISGGEEDLANLVLRLAISQMIAERAGQAFSLLILDEVFGSLDESRRHNVVELLRRLHDRFEQVVLITHIESVREGLDRVLTVRYDEESRTSKVESESAAILDRDDTMSDEYAEAGAAD